MKDYKKKLKDAMDDELVPFEVQEWIKENFPELVESEDERIRKELICFLETEIPQCNARDKYIAWLEKQGEQKSADNIPQDFEKYVEHLLSLSDGEGHSSPAKVKEVSAELFKLAQLEQKPAWSDEDETHITNIIIMLKEGASLHFTEDNITKSVSWLKSLRERYTWKPSDEQMEALDFAVDCVVPDEFNFKKASLRTLFNDLKKL